MKRAEPTRATAGAGFTLLEVLAAFLIFAVIFTVLAGSASQAFRTEGENRRRFEASLLADAAFAAIEQQARAGAPPTLGEEFEERDIFTLTTVVSALSADSLGLDLTRQGSEGTARDASAAAAPSILRPEPNQEPILRHIELVVSWEEGDRLVEVRRATIAFDATQLQGLPGETEGAQDEAADADEDVGGEIDLNDPDLIPSLLKQIDVQ